MKRTGILGFLYLAYLSRPAQDRQVYRAINRLRVNAIVEIGVGMGERSRGMIRSALRHHDPRDVFFTGIDLFETRPESQPGLTLKATHSRLKETGVHVRLIPGDPFSALARSANGLTATDLIVISADQDQNSLDEAWFYVPRMLHDGSIVMIETGADNGYQLLTAEQARSKVDQTKRGARAA